MKVPLVSICVQTYNHKDYIKQCLDGILMQQTKFNFEIILGEDESNDGTRDICQEYKNKYPDIIILFLRNRNDVIYINDKPTGRYNFIENIKSCHGKYIALCEGDDYWTDPLKLQKQVDFLETHLDYSLCFHKVQILKPNKQLVEDYITNVPNDSETISTLVQHGNYIHTPSVVFRNCISDLPFEFTEAPFGDFFLYFILAHHGKLKYIDEDMAVYRSGIGLISNMTERIMSANYVKLYSCMISFTTDPSLKKIIMDKQQEVLRSYIVQFDNEYWALKNELKSAFVSHSKLFKGLKYLQSKYWKLKLKKKGN